MYKLIEHKEVIKYPSFTIYDDKVQTSDGIIQRQMVERVDASAILPIFPNGDLLLCKQYRHAVGQELFEIPAGKIDAGETPEEGAARELYEEVGIKVDKLNYLLEIYPSPGIISEKIYIYTVNITESDIGEQHLDDGEDIDIVRLPLETVSNMIANGKIQDGKTICAINLYQLKNMKQI